MKWAIAVYYPEISPRLFWDAAYAEQTEHGGIVAPEEFNPFNWQPLIPLRESDCVKAERYFRLAVPDAARGEMNGGEEVEYTGVRIRPGDVITRKSAIHRYTEHPTSRGPMLLTTVEKRWFNQDGALLKNFWLTLIRLTAAGNSGAIARSDPRGGGGPRPTTAAPNGHAPLPIFEALAAGQEIPPFQRETGLANWNRFAAANYEFADIHMDDESAQAHGWPSSFGQGHYTFSCQHILLRDWLGDRGWIRRASCQFRRPNFKKEVVTTHGVIRRKYEDNGLRLVDLDVWSENQHGQVLAPGAATVVLK
jgi:acyl dehydratase